MVSNIQSFLSLPQLPSHRMSWLDHQRSELSLLTIARTPNKSTMVTWHSHTHQFDQYHDSKTVTIVSLQLKRSLAHIPYLVLPLPTPVNLSGATGLSGLVLLTNLVLLHLIGMTIGEPTDRTNALVSTDIVLIRDQRGPRCLHLAGITGPRDLVQLYTDHLHRFRLLELSQHSPTARMDNRSQDTPELPPLLQRLFRFLFKN